jgi:hypothetical protein
MMTAAPLRLQEFTKLRIYLRFAFLLSLLALAASMSAQEGKDSGSLHGQVTDPSGAVVVGATVSVTTPDGHTQKALTDKSGNYVVHGLPVGNVTVDATATGFAPYQMPNVIIPAGQPQQLDIAFGIAVQKEQVTVQDEGTTVDVNPANNASAIILKGEDLEALSDDPDDLEQDLLALAGPSVGPNGGQIYIDGFSNGTLPPKASIREIRINQNPFSAEYDRPGFGRIEVFTKPGSDKWHGQLMFNENNSVFNARNPYVLTPIPSYHSENYTGNVSGALTKKLSIFLNAEHRSISDFDAVATTLAGPSQAVASPRSRTNVSERLDWQLTPSNTLSARYQFLINDQQNLGIGGLALQSQGYSSDETQHTLQLSDTQILGPHVINETRFQFIHDDTTQAANQFGAAINVLGEFSGGGSAVNRNSDSINRYELQNYTSLSVGKHFVKFGGRLRAYQDNSFALTNTNGSLSYGALCEISASPLVLCPNPNVIPSNATILTPFDAYKLGTPSQLSIVNIVPGKDPRISLSFADVGLYAEDDWKLRPNLTLSYGLRFESQSSISDKADFAPRLGLSWGLGSAKSTPKTVLRVGYGIFYDRFTEDLVLQAERLNGEIEQQTIYTSTPSTPILCPPGVSPSSPLMVQNGGCTFSGGSTTLYQINPNLRAPYTMQSAVSLERQLGRVGTVSVTYLNSRGLHQFILENVNAPDPNSPFDGARPLSAQYGNDNLYQYNSEAIFKQNQLITNVQIRLSRKLSLTGYYTLNYANSDTGGASSNPSNQYNLSQDYGRASFDIRNRLFLAGSASLAHNIRISPFVVANSGAPFNITTGRDNNGDSFFNDRPSFTTPGAPGAVTNQYGSFNLNPTPGQRIIPINYGNGPASVTINMRFAKTFGFGAETKKPAAAPDQDAGGKGSGHGGGHGGLGGPGRAMGSVFAPSNTTRRYNLTFTATARNLFNTWNPGSPIGNLSSTMFGKTTGLAGGPFSSGGAYNRRVDFQALFSF